jgi:hypothetical protein
VIAGFRDHRSARKHSAQPQAARETAAEALGLPFSTYRRHLSDGIAAVVDLLWRQENGQ